MFDPATVHQGTLRLQADYVEGSAVTEIHVMTGQGIKRIKAESLLLSENAGTPSPLKTPILATSPIRSKGPWSSMMPCYLLISIERQRQDFCDHTK